MRPVIIEFHHMKASLGTRLWPMVPESFMSKKDEKAWEKTLTQVRELIENELLHFGYTSYIWNEKFDKTFITPMRNHKPILIKKKDNLEHYAEEEKNLENCRAHMEYLLLKNIPIIYYSQLHSK